MSFVIEDRVAEYNTLSNLLEKEAMKTDQEIIQEYNETINMRRTALKQKRERLEALGVKFDVDGQ